MSKQNEFDVKIKGVGIDIHRKVHENIGRRIVSILLGGVGGDQNQDTESTDHPVDDTPGGAERAPANREAFFAGLKNDKPSDNALAVAAYHYAQYGSSEFTVDEMQELADDVGVTVPERLDKTYLAARRKGNSLFRRGGRGAFRPTVHGEAHFKRTYKVSKGTSRKPTAPVK